MESVVKRSELIWKIGLTLLIALSTLFQYYLQTSFVSQKIFTAEKSEALRQYTADRRELNDQMAADRRQVTEQIRSIERGLSELNTTVRLMNQNQATLVDHEARLRALERNK